MRLTGSAARVAEAEYALPTGHDPVGLGKPLTARRDRNRPPIPGPAGPTPESRAAHSSTARRCEARGPNSGGWSHPPVQPSGSCAAGTGRREDQASRRRGRAPSAPTPRARTQPPPRRGPARLTGAHQAYIDAPRAPAHQAWRAADPPSSRVPSPFPTAGVGPRRGDAPGAGRPTPRTQTPGGAGRTPLQRRRAAGSSAGFENPSSPGLTFTPGATISSMRSSRAGSSETSAAGSWDSRCSIVRGPMIAAVTAGMVDHPGDGELDSDRPASSASAPSASAASSLRWLAGNREVEAVRQAAGPARGRQLGVLAVAAREPSAGERAPRDDADAVSQRARQHVCARCRGPGSSRAAARSRSAPGRARAPPTAPRRSAEAGRSRSRCSGPCRRGRGR